MFCRTENENRRLRGTKTERVRKRGKATILKTSKSTTIIIKRKYAAHYGILRDTMKLGENSATDIYFVIKVFPIKSIIKKSILK